MRLFFHGTPLRDAFVKSSEWFTKVKLGSFINKNWNSIRFRAASGNEPAVELVLVGQNYRPNFGQI